MPTNRKSTSMTESDLRSSETIKLIGSDKVEGTEVYNRQGEHLGHIEKLMIDKLSGNVAYAVMSFGGFLGIGEAHYPLPWQALDYVVERDGYVVDIDRSKLEGAPSFAPGADPAWEDPVLNEEIYGYYGLSYPYQIV